MSSAGPPSLEASIRTCKVDTALANKIESDRFLNTDNMLCPIWNGYDSTGRQVCADSFYTKSAGCNSAEDRVVVENDLRPKYMEYITLNAQGIAGNMYGNTMMTQNSMLRTRDLTNVPNITGNFGLDMGSYTIPPCKNYPSSQAMAQLNQQARNRQGIRNAYGANNFRSIAGM
jgi:hypothetical protein